MVGGIKTAVCRTLRRVITYVNNATIDIRQAGHEAVKAVAIHPISGDGDVNIALSSRNINRRWDAQRGRKHCFPDRAGDCSVNRSAHHDRGASGSIRGSHGPCKCPCDRGRPDTIDDFCRAIDTALHQNAGHRIGVVPRSQRQGDLLVCENPVRGCRGGGDCGRRILNGQCSHWSQPTVIGPSSASDSVGAHILQPDILTFMRRRQHKAVAVTNVGDSATTVRARLPTQGNSRCGITLVDWLCRDVDRFANAENAIDRGASNTPWRGIDMGCVAVIERDLDLFELLVDQPAGSRADA